MCGICGILSQDKGSQQLEKITTDMTRSLHHRGPDAKGVWSDQPRIAFGHARLSIIDLSPNGLQPMTSKSQRYTICFNGEIYNYKSLIKSLEDKNIALRGQSDTEALLECIDLFGLQWTLENAIGMYAFALWDAKAQKLTLCRDRMGEKPLYYGVVGRDLVFASELKAFKQHPEFTSEVSTEALSAFVKYCYVPTPLCIFKGVKKLTAASLVSGSTPEELFACEPEIYWKAKPSQSDHGLDLEGLLTDAVQKQMVSDVPIGCFLSGGIDSSLISAIMQAQKSTPIDTFTIGFNESDYDESMHAKAVADHIGSNHHEATVSSTDVLNLVPRVAEIYDEPFADASQMPTTLLSQMTKQKVTVCLSGDGGDELFCGYERYKWAKKLGMISGGTPQFVKSGINSVVHSRSTAQWDSMFNLLPAKLRSKVSSPGRKLYAASEFLNFKTHEQVYDRLMSHWQSPESLVIGGSAFSTVEGSFDNNLSMMENAMAHDIKYYLTDDIMTKVDRATMSASLESRAPMLDHRIVEYAQSLTVDEKTQHGKAKYPLREILYKYVPEKIIERPKMGFGVPLEHWFRNELKPWAEERLDPILINKQGFFQAEPIQQSWQQHQEKTHNRQYQLWAILVFQEWYSKWCQS